MKVNNTLLLPQRFPAPWASAWGQDRFGLYMELDCRGVRQRFRWILPGTFLMGSPTDEPERESYRVDETQHQVTLTQGFWLADSVCTQALWQAVMSNNPARFQNDASNPVENVSWKDAQAFITELNELFPGLSARLPTEAEWEYACRADTNTPFSFGNNITPEQVNYYGDYPYANGQIGSYRGKTNPVKTLPPNPWGLHEMHGNIWEWCADWYGSYPQQAVTNPLGPDQGTTRVLRGGYWNSSGRGVRSAHRYKDWPGHRGGDIGFRLALG